MKYGPYGQWTAALEASGPLLGSPLAPVPTSTSKLSNCVAMFHFQAHLPSFPTPDCELLRAEALFLSPLYTQYLALVLSSVVR